MTDTKAWYAQRDHRPAERCLITRRGGLLLFAAPPNELRDWAVDTAGLSAHNPGDMDYTYLDNHWPTNGEVQIFRRYRAMVSSAVTARQEILAADTGRDTEQAVRERIWRRSAEVRRRRG